MSSFTRSYLAEAVTVIERLDAGAIDNIAGAIAKAAASGGRLFLLGVGGSAANAAHAVNDFRKIAGIEAYSPTDNVAELTARTNDDGWATVFEAWLRVSRLTAKDVVFVLSVSGGNVEKSISMNIVRALDYARSIGSTIVGIVGGEGGYTKQVADFCVCIPTVNTEHVTMHSEAFQAVIWHLMMCHPALRPVHA